MNLRQKYKAVKKYAKLLEKGLSERKKENSTIVPFVVAKTFPRGVMDLELDGYLLQSRIEFEKLLFNHIHEHLDDYVDIIWEDDLSYGSKRLLYKVWLKKIERNKPKSIPALAVGDIGKYTFPMHVDFGPIHPSLGVDEDPWHDDRTKDNITWFNTRSLK